MVNTDKMCYLINTHIFLWWLNGDKNLKKSVQTIIENPQNQIYVSAASLGKSAQSMQLVNCSSKRLYLK